MTECSICGTSATKKCGKCKKVYYCSEKCQRGDWCNHKKICGFSNYGNSNISTVIVGDNTTIAVTSNAPEYVASHAIANQSLVNLVWPEVPKLEGQITELHVQGIRCFINFEVALADVANKNAESKIIIKSMTVDKSDRAEEIAKIAGSQKLVHYCKTYDTNMAIPIVVWCAEPWSCYTFLTVQPWKNTEYLQKNK